MNVMPYTRYLIVGGSAAGMAAAEAIRSLDPNGSIRVLSDEIDAPYFRPMIPFLVSRKKEADQIYLAGQGPYKATDVELCLGTRAKKIDIDGRQVITEDGNIHPYDQLLIATGSRPHIPPAIKGTDTFGVFALRSLEDARQVSIRAEHTEHAIMLGGGLLNLKAAFALLERNIKVTLVVNSPEVLSQLMEPEDAFLIRQALDNAGLRIITGANATEIIADSNGVKGVGLDNGDEISCQMICIGKGVVPNIEWLDQSGIMLEGGVVVDKHTQTNVPEIHAAGDVAVTFDPISGESMMTGLWTNAVEMGRCAGTNMAGRQTAYGGTFGILNATQVAEMPFVSMGIVHTQNTAYETHSKKAPSSYRKLVFSPEDDGCLVGALFIGDISKAGLYKSLIREKWEVGGIKKNLMDNTLHYGHLLCNVK